MMDRMGSTERGVRPRAARGRLLALLAAGLLVANGAQAQNAVRGQTLFFSTNGAPLSCGSNGCHDGFPATRRNGINAGANPQAILSAIMQNRGGMIILNGFVSSQDAADIAAYIANPAAAAGSSIAVSPTALLFPTTTAGSASGVLSVSVTNGGSAALSLTSISLAGTNASEFRIAGSSTCANGGSVAAGANCRIDVTFNPTSDGAKTASIAIVHSAAGSPTNVPLNGTAGAAQPMMSLSAASIAFPNTPVGATSATQTIRVTNIGTAALNITALTAGGANPAEFTRTGTCIVGRVLQPLGECTVTYAFAPAALGARSANLTIGSNSASGPVTLNVTGSGVDNTPLIALSRGALAFDRQQINTTSPAQTVVVRNDGGGTLSITAVASSAAVFTAAGNCLNANLTNQQSCTLSVTFRPTAAVASTGVVSLTHNAPGSPSEVMVSGMGSATPVPVVTLSRSAIDFAGVTPVGQSSFSERVTVTNSGPGPVTLGALTGAPEFNLVAGVAGACVSGQDLAQGSACNVDVRFTPAASGTRSGTLSITSNGSPGNATVALTGTGSAAAGAVALPNPQQVEFGSVRLGQTSSARPLTLTNSGTTNLVVNDLAVSGPYELAAGGTCGARPFVLTPGSGCLMSLTYTPTSTDVQQGALQIASNGAPVTVALTGRGDTAGAGGGAGTGASFVRPSNVGFGGGAPAAPWLTMMGLIAALFARRRLAG
jgi:hypothetical protein